METEIFFGNKINNKGVYFQFVRMHVGLKDDKIIYEPFDESEHNDQVKMTESERDFFFDFLFFVEQELKEAIKQGRKSLFFSDSQLNTIFEIIKPKV